jgi:hypothetical protein
MLPPENPHGYTPIFWGLVVVTGLLLFLGALFGVVATVTAHTH